MAAKARKKTKKPAKPARARKPARAARKPARAAKKASPKPRGPVAIPAGYEGAIPYLIIAGASGALEFYKRAFGAVELLRMNMPGGMVAHAEMKIGRALFMVADEFPDMGFRGPKGIGGTPVSVLVYVPDVDAIVSRAIGAGATVKKPLQDQFYGDRSATLEDPFGHVWSIATHKEDVSPAEMERRMAGMMGGGAPCPEEARAPASSATIPSGELPLA